MNESVLNEILKNSKRKADESEVHYFEREELTLVFDNENLVDLVSKESMQTSLRIIKNGKIGFGTVSGNNDNSNDIIQCALDSYKYQQDSLYSLENDQQVENSVKICNEYLYNLSLKETIDIYSSIAMSLKKQMSIKNHTCIGSLLKDTVCLIQNNGKKRSYKKSIIALKIEGDVLNKGQHCFYKYNDANCLCLQNNEHILHDLQQQLKYPKKSIDLINSEYVKVILSSNAMYEIFRNMIAMGFNGKRLSAGILNTESYQNGLTIQDSGNINGKINSQPFDDEGTSCCDTLLLDNGKKVGNILDKRTASLVGKMSTGNGKRCWGTPPVPVPNNIIISFNRNICLEEAVDSIDEGYLIEQVMNDGSSNYLNGYFSGYILQGYVIKNGRIIGRSDKKRMKLYMAECFNNIESTVNSSKWIGGEMQSPGFLFSKVFIY